MTVTSRLRIAAVTAVALAAALAVAACGSSTATPSPTAAPSAPAASAEASTVPASPAVSPSPDAASPDATTGVASLPPLTAVPDLEKMIPTTLAGYPVTVRSLTGSDIVASGDQASIAALDAILKATDSTAADYGFAWGIVKTGAATDSVVGVFRVTGADPAAVRDALIAQAGGTANVESGSIGGKSVQILRLPSQDGTLWSWYYWPKGDVLFYVQSTDPTVAEKVLAAL